MPSNGEPRNSRPTHADLLAVMRDVHGWCDALSTRIEKQTEHIDQSLSEIRQSIEALREATNHRMEQFETRVDSIEKKEAARLALATFKNALLKGSWKLTTFIVMAASMISGLITRYGAPWMWHFGK